MLVTSKLKSLAAALTFAVLAPLSGAAHADCAASVFYEFRYYGNQEAYIEWNLPDAAEGTQLWLDDYGYGVSYWPVYMGQTLFRCENGSWRI